MAGQKYVEIAGTELTFYHYKEPLLAVPAEKGFGYYGAMLSSLDGSKIMCHICGKLYGELQLHVRQAHKISVKEYRELFQLAHKTKLISEKVRLDRKRRFWKMLKDRPELYEKYKANWKKPPGRRGNLKQPKLTLETHNKRGTCPDQLLDKIREVKERIGHVPSLKEFVAECGTQRYKHLIFKVYGSWANALQLLAYPQKKNTGKGRGRHKKEELLELLEIFAQDNDKIPTSTDCNRGLLPDMRVFVRVFGSFEEARSQAGVYEIVGKTIEGQRISLRQKLTMKSKGDTDG